MKENPIRTLPGIPMLLTLRGGAIAGAYLVVAGAQASAPFQVIVGVLLAMVAMFCLLGLYMVEPNQSAVVSLFGKYIGTVKDNGLRWNNPFFSKKKVSQRVRNF